MVALNRGTGAAALLWGGNYFPHRSSYALKDEMDVIIEYSMDDDREIGGVSAGIFLDCLNDQKREFNEALEESIRIPTQFSFFGVFLATFVTFH